MHMVCLTYILIKKDNNNKMICVTHYTFPFRWSIVILVIFMVLIFIFRFSLLICNLIWVLWVMCSVICICFFNFYLALFYFCIISFLVFLILKLISRDVYILFYLYILALFQLAKMILVVVNDNTTAWNIVFNCNNCILHGHMTSSHFLTCDWCSVINLELVRTVIALFFLCD